MIDRGQVTVCWHMDDLKIAHKDKVIVNKFVMALADEFVPKTTISVWTKSNNLRGESALLLGDGP